ncbi:MAG: alkylphosphonate utilization protein [Proteobacteria bacterium]|jgi:protein PhnA|nr:alkylphosphonate utilization protein [Pseudomonadota bacterium]
MTETVQTCPKCNSEDAYFDGSLWNCPSCFHEWVLSDNDETEVAIDTQIRDAHGNVLQEGDSVTVIKDLKIKGSSSSVKVGTKVKNIKLIMDSNDGHNIGCKIDGFGAMNLKSEFVKKS